MTLPLNTDQERLLTSVACGELDPQANEIVAESQRSPEFAAELERLSNVVSRLERAVDESREDIDLAGRETHAPGEHAVESAVKAGLTKERALTIAQPATSRMTFWLLAAAAALMLAALFFPYGHDDATVPDSSGQLGDAVQCLAPRGEAQDFREFRFAGTRPDGAWFEILIRDRDGAEIVRSSRLETNVLTLSDVELAALPEEIEWQVFLRDVGGIRGTSKAFAKR